VPSAPTAPTVALAGESVPIDPALLEAAVGPNTAYYRDRWAKMDAKGSAISWNWPACLLNFFWFAYRKMWLPMAGVFAASFALSLIAGTNPAFGEISWLFSIAITFVTGAFGNYLYRQQIEKLVEETAPLGRTAQLEALASRGGVSKVALFVSIGAIAAAGALSYLASTGWNPRPAPPDNRTAPARDNGLTPAIPPVTPPGGVPGYDDPGARPQQPQQPPEVGTQDPGAGEEMPPEERSFGEDEARQDEIEPPVAPE